MMNENLRACSVTMESEMTPSETGSIRSLLAQAGLKGAHLEIGTAAGGTLRLMMSCYDGAIRPPFVVIDPMAYFPNQKEVVCQNLLDGGIDPSTVDFRTGLSADIYARSRAQGDRFSFILIDGNHKTRYVMEDMRWCHCLESGGYVALHDYAALHPGVIWAAEHFLAKNPNYRKVSLADSLLILQKQSGGATEVSALDIVQARFYDIALRLRRSLGKHFSARAR